jgi:dipeptidyl aminopeptidase/acylaminoacyl peptidase
MAGWVSVRSLCATLVALAGVAAAAPAAWSTFPGLNGQLAYEAGGGATRNVFTIQPLAGLSGEGTRLTDARTIDRDAAWSPDGRRIAFMSERDGNPEIYVMTATPGSVPTRLTFDPAVDVDPTFSPDGRRLAFTSTRDGNPEIYVMAVDGSAQTRVTFDPAADQQADWSPDGTRIAFESTRDGNHEIYAMNPDGGAVTRLTFSPEFAADPSWHPDGASIAFVSGPRGALDIFTVRPGTAGRTQLTRGTSDVHHPAWSPDGQQIAFTSFENTLVMKADARGTAEFAANGADAAWGPLPPPPRVPELSQTVNLEPTGTIFVRVNGAEAAAPLAEPLEIPVGSVIDTTRGEVEVEAATPNERSTSSVAVSGGRATVSQTDGGVTVFRLPRTPCCGDRRTRLRTQTRARTTAPMAARRGRCRRGGTLSPKHGRTYGCLTNWTTIRAGRKTTVRVRSGVVEVTDFVRDRTVRVGDCQPRNRDCWPRDWYVIRARR